MPEYTSYFQVHFLTEWVVSLLSWLGFGSIGWSRSDDLKRNRAQKWPPNIQSLFRFLVKCTYDANHVQNRRLYIFPTSDECDFDLPRSKVLRRIDGKPGVVAKRQADRQDGKAHEDRPEFPSRSEVPRVPHGKDHAGEEGSRRENVENARWHGTEDRASRERGEVVCRHHRPVQTI